MKMYIICNTRWIWTYTPCNTDLWTCAILYYEGHDWPKNGGVSNW